ncbi:MAG: hypothetical protein GY875_07500 [Gammaproteobacteria bacterium]|nr:hypothetical protein [Gammaproteobacteria bacterium]
MPFIAFDQNCFYRQWASKELANSSQRLDVVLECASNEGVCSAVSAGMGVALIAKRHIRSDMEKVSIIEPPNIVFVVRTGNTERSNHLSVLRDDILNSLAK